MYTTTIKKAKLISEPELIGALVEYKTDKSVEFVPVINLLDWIERNRLNVEHAYSGNNSPYGDGNPEYDEFEEIEILTADEYLDKYFEEVSVVYFKEVIAA